MVNTPRFPLVLALQLMLQLMQLMQRLLAPAGPLGLSWPPLWMLQPSSLADVLVLSFCSQSDCRASNCFSGSSVVPSLRCTVWYQP